jgi:hypothetical protein
MVEGAARQKRKSGAGKKPGGEPRAEYPESYGTTDGDEELESSEALVPEELWEELVGVARGNVPVPGERASRSTTIGRRAAPIPRVGGRSEAREPETPVSYDDLAEEDAYDRTVREGALAPDLVVRAERVPEPLARPEPVEIAGVVGATPVRPTRATSFRRLFRNREDIQRAILIREILGPPISMRGSTD